MSKIRATQKKNYDYFVSPLTAFNLIKLKALQKKIGVFFH